MRSQARQRKRRLQPQPTSRYCGGKGFGRSGGLDLAGGRGCGRSGGPEPEVPVPAPSPDGAYRSDTNGCSRRIGIRALGCAADFSALGVVASFCVIVGSGGASVGAWANALVAPVTVAATAAIIVVLIRNLLSLPLWQTHRPESCSYHHDKVRSR